MGKTHVKYWLLCILSLISSMIWAKGSSSSGSDIALDSNSSGYKILHRSAGWGSIEMWTNRSKPIFLYLKTEGRFYFNEPTGDALHVRPAIAYNVTDKLSVYLGYEFIQGLNSPDKKLNMIWQQAEYHVIDTDRIYLESRTRLEQEFSVAGNGAAVIIRERVLLRFNHLITPTLSPVFLNEVFISLHSPKWAALNTFMENRALIGVEKLVFKKAAIRFGYLNELLFTAPAKEITNAVMASFVIELE